MEENGRLAPQPRRVARLARTAWLRLRAVRLDNALFLAALGLFVVTRFIGLERFPVYFFGDEAIQTVQAAELLQHHFHDSQGRLLPTYFQNGMFWNLSVSVYAQVLPYKLFGYSILATRGTSALFALSGTAAVSLILRDIFKVRAWWLGALFLSVTPAWFLHSRTAFETVIAASFYAWFLYFYLRYLCFSGVNLYVALVFAALAFYAYASIQLVIVTTGLAFALSNARLHVREWPTSLKAAAILAILAFPYLRFQFGQGEEVLIHLRTLDSYWVKPGLSLGAKLERFWSEYRLGLNRSYWVGTDNHRDLVRHQMKGYGHISVLAVPFIVLGLARCIRHVRSASHRGLLLALLLAPVGAAIVAIMITRALVVVVPAAILAGLGAALVIDLLSRRLPYAMVACTSFALLAAANLYMLGDSLRNGATWYDDYEIGGLQFGARQVSAEIRDYLKESPDSRIILSPTWANGTDTVMHFLLPDEPRLSLGTIDAYVLEKLPLPASTVFVMTPREFGRTRDDPRFAPPEVVETVRYPNGAPGFYFARIRYSAEADAIFAREAEIRSQPLTQRLEVGRRPAEVVYSRLDIGRIVDVFDGDRFTLGRTIEANPAIFDITFDLAQQVRSITLATGTLRLDLVVRVFESPDADPKIYTLRMDRAETDPTVTLALPDGPVARRFRIEVGDLNSPPGKAHIHVREITLQ
jgi:hypothetical protein